LNSTNEINGPNKEQEIKDQLASALSQMFGAKVVPHSQLNHLSIENKRLAKQLDSIKKTSNNITPKFIKYYCYFLGFKAYHTKWKPLTRKVESRTKKLISEKVMLNFEDAIHLPDDVKSNLKEAYNYYINDMKMSCYIMLLRTLEISINHIYDPLMNPKKKFIPAKVKLDWISKQGILKGVDYQIMKGFVAGRNEAIHLVFEPTEKQLLSAFETVETIINQLSKS